ncbi:transglycosylase domain-containing protein [Rhodococcoides kyotonense]|uniref:Transglycosylase n=1 Tax=Rhodococcoides kyotonense TaxID=398843 RepID=A0A239MV85_9NOCA|nr:transglycosylase domain-containing protein [Rhodococcus kyotonensis]SNT46641.1 Transglycosylase [Rhodococcus kyotonensis]
MRESDELTPTYDLPDLKPAESPEPPDRKSDPPNERLYLLIEFIIFDVILRTLWMTGYLVAFTLGFLVFAIVVVLLLCTIAVMPHWWMNNYETAFMEANENQPIVHEWVDIDHMSLNALAAAIVLEDVDFGDRVLAFNIDKFIDTAQQHMAGLEPEGGSTIPQQLAKNLYLTEGRSAIRKALEAPLSMTLNAMMSERPLKASTEDVLTTRTLAATMTCIRRLCLRGLREIIATPLPKGLLRLQTLPL